MCVAASVCVYVFARVCVRACMQLSDCSPVTVFSMETDTPTAEDIQLLKKTVESEASQVRARLGQSQPRLLVR